MMSRICVYKNCNNFYQRELSNHFTLFAFPKDPKRAELWRQFGQVHPKLANNQLFMCSKHFDPKFLAVAKKRTILVGEAVPNVYKEKDSDSKEATSTSSLAQQRSYINKISTNSVLNTSTRHNNAKKMLSSSSLSPNSFLIKLDNDEFNVENVVMVESTTVNAREDDNCIKLESNEIEVSIVPPSRKRAHSPISPPSPLSNQQEEPATDDDELIDSAEVSLFKFKGEQYVQMSQEYYLQEKRQMLDQLRTYKRILSNFKMKLNTLENI